MSSGSGQIIVRGTLIGADSPSDVFIDQDGIVSAVRPISKLTPHLGSQDALIAPTLFDIQVNGAFGIDLQDDALCPEHVYPLSKRLASCGISAWIPTLITASQESLLRKCRVFAELLQDPNFAASVPGIHLEGPYISPHDGPRGAHAREFVRKPSIREFEKLFKAAEGRICYVTLAPESEGAIRFIRAVKSLGVSVALGHHAAMPEQITRAVDAGANLCTHLGNGLASQIHRHHNPLWAQLADDRLTASVIADLEHLPPPVLKCFVRMKGVSRIILTSDVVHLAGLPSGEYTLMGVPVRLRRSGRICLAGTDLLAGSSLMLLQGVVNAASTTDLTLDQAFQCAGTIPARFFGLRKTFQLPKPGSPADFIVFRLKDTQRGKNVEVLASFVDGRRRQ